jgi:ribosomal-protein-alanine N-acetyltransferase
VAVNRVALVEGAVAAYSSCWNVARELQIHNVAVDAGWRRRGLGRWLLISLLRDAVRCRCRTATLEVRAGNAPARRLYLELGFEEVGRRSGYYRRENEDAVLMTLVLPDSLADAGDTMCP